MPNHVSNEIRIICNDEESFNVYLNNILKNYDYFYNKIFVNKDSFNFENYKKYFNSNFNKLLI